MILANNDLSLRRLLDIILNICSPVTTNNGQDATGNEIWVETISRDSGTGLFSWKVLIARVVDWLSTGGLWCLPQSPRDFTTTLRI